jgi:hypothetical protein
MKTQRITIGVTFALALAVAHAESSSGGRFTLNGGPVSGGGRSGGGNFAVNGGAGETSTAQASGGNFQVTGGLVGIVVIPGEVEVSITTASGQIRLTWPDGTAGYVLESSAQIGAAANWQAVTPAPSANTFTTPANQSLRFFRLRKP